MRSAAPALCLTFLIASGAQAHAAADAIGSTVTVVNTVTAQLARETRMLATGDDVRQNEIIEVGLDASSEIELKDQTKLALGPGSRLVLDRFVYNPEATGGSIFVNLAKGTFRFITGVAEKPAYVIRVPSASITVRGTIFDVFVEASGRSWLLLHEGAVRICNDRGTCRDHDEVGKIIPITDMGQLGKPSRWASLPGVQNVSFDDAFPFVVKTTSFDSAPVLPRERIVGTEPVRPERPSAPDANDGGKTPHPGKRVETPKLKKTVKLPKLGKKHVELPRLRTTGRKDGILDAVATYAPKLADRIKQRRQRADDDTGETSLSAGGLLGHRHKKSMPD